MGHGGRCGFHVQGSATVVIITLDGISVGICGWFRVEALASGPLTGTQAHVFFGPNFSFVIVRCISLSFVCQAFGIIFIRWGGVIGSVSAGPGFLVLLSIFSEAHFFR